MGFPLGASIWGGGGGGGGYKIGNMMMSRDLSKTGTTYY